MSTENRPAAVSESLRTSSAAVRVSFTWFGVRKSLNVEQRSQIADGFEAQTTSISAGKKLLNTKHDAYKAVTALKTEITAYWKEHSLPFPEPGVRLIRRERVESFAEEMDAYRARLAEAVANLDDHYADIKEGARVDLGSLYNPSDYPETLRGLFAVAWEFPNVEPPSYLMELQPALYEQERARVASQFDEAVRLAEEAFLEQFAEVVGHLCDRLGKDEATGETKVFRDSAVTNLTEFFDRFGTLGLHSNARLDALVEQARLAVRGTTPARIRTSTEVREAVAGRLAAVESALSGMIVDKPRRRILRPTTAAANGSES